MQSAAQAEQQLTHSSLRLNITDWVAAEEVQDAGQELSWSMVWSLIINMPVTYDLLIFYLFCIGHVSEPLSFPTGYPFIYVF